MVWNIVKLFFEHSFGMCLLIAVFEYGLEGRCWKVVVEGGF